MGKKLKSLNLEAIFNKSLHPCPRFRNGGTLNPKFAASRFLILKDPLSSSAGPLEFKSRHEHA